MKQPRAPDSADDAGLLDPKVLRLFELLYGTRSVTRAAEQLAQSQPTVSIWLGRLRRDLGDPLFVRTAAGMQPTPRADALIGPVRDALQALRRIGGTRPRFAPQTSERRFRICMTDASHVTLLPQLLAHVRALAPAVTLEAARIDAGTARALQGGEADLALGYVPWLEAGFYQQALYPQDWVCLVGARHPRVGERITLREYRAEAHVGIVSGTGAELLTQALQRQRVRRRTVLELPGFLGLGAILSTTDLMATLPRHIGRTLADSAGLRLLECPLKIEGFVVKQHWHERYHHDEANRWLRGVVAELFGRRGA